MQNPFSLEGKTILVTGASAGIGRAIAIACAGMGAIVCITARNKIRLDETMRMMEGMGHLSLAADISVQENINSLVTGLPKLDGVVHCAGVGSRVLCKSINEKDIESVLVPNFKGPVLLQTALLSQKKVNKSASIVFIASRAADVPSVGNAVYSASKGAIISYSKCLGLELAPRQIRVNCICPAMVWTDLIVQDGISKEDLELSQLKYPLKRYGQPDDIAHLTVYLLSNASCWMTGSCIDITGGAKEL